MSLIKFVGRGILGLLFGFLFFFLILVGSVVYIFGSNLGFLIIFISIICLFIALYFANKTNH